MDRFIAIDLAIQKNGSGDLKSNMDRFIDQSPNENDYRGKNLKSNMDRFIDSLQVIQLSHIGI